MDESALLSLARSGDDWAFGELVAPYRGELHAHCYRLLASSHDADDALQETLIGAWRGIGGFEGRSTLRSWLYRIATHAAYRVANRRPKRQLSFDVAQACADPWSLGEALDEPVWVEPYPGDRVDALTVDPSASYDALESVELAFVSALQHLPASQRAVLLLREVLAFSASEVAETLDLTVTAVNSQLQRARATLALTLPGRTQQAVLRGLGGEADRLVRDLVTAWEARDVNAFVALLSDDVRFSMPPLPAWFDGIAAVQDFVTERLFATPWRLAVTTASGQLALSCWQGEPDSPRQEQPSSVSAGDGAGTGDAAYHLGGLTVLTLGEGRIVELTSFLAPLLTEGLGLTDEFVPPAVS